LIRLWKAMLLVDLALGLGLGFGYLRWGLEATTLRRRVEEAEEAAARAPLGEGPWVVQAIVRGVIPDRGALLLTHEAIPGVMAGMTMGFPVEDPALLRGPAPGDRVLVTLRLRGDRLVLGGLEPAPR
jgi:Cu/Ag efflux protein CusF